MKVFLSFATDATEDGRYVAAVIGWKADVAFFHEFVCKTLRVRAIHMIRLDDKPGASNLLSKVSRSIWLYCFRADMPAHLAMLMKKKGDRTPKHVLWECLDYCVGMEIKKSIQPALTFFNKQYSELTVEADPDTERVMKPTGIPVLQPAATHQIADMVAWFNHARNAPKPVREIDISDKVFMRLKKRLKI